MYANFSNVARNILSIIPHGLGVVARFSLWPDVITWRQSKTTGETLPEMIVVRKCARTNYMLLAGDDAALVSKNTDNILEMKREEEQMKLH
jgi:hypothetical protein